MNQDSKIYVAGHKGMVGSAIVRKLQREGFTNILTARDLLGVQCEVCHGPGSLHVKDNTANKMRHLTSATDCISCHNPENDDNFVYAEKLKKIQCPAK